MTHREATGRRGRGSSRWLSQSWKTDAIFLELLHKPSQRTHVGVISELIHPIHKEVFYSLGHPGVRARLNREGTSDR